MSTEHKMLCVLSIWWMAGALGASSTAVVEPLVWEMYRISGAGMTGPAWEGKR